MGVPGLQQAVAGPVGRVECLAVAGNGAALPPVFRQPSVHARYVQPAQQLQLLPQAVKTAPALPGRPQKQPCQQRRGPAHVTAAGQMEAAQP